MLKSHVFFSKRNFICLQLHRKDEEIRDLHERNSHLNIQIDHLTEKASNSSGHSMTLFNELSQLPGNQEMSMATGSPINPVCLFTILFLNKSHSF